VAYEDVMNMFALPYPVNEILFWESAKKILLAAYVVVDQPFNVFLCHVCSFVCQQGHVITTNHVCLIDFFYYLPRPDSLLKPRRKQYDLSSDTIVNKPPISKLSPSGTSIPNNGKITTWAATATP